MSTMISLPCDVQPPPEDEWSIGYDFEHKCLIILHGRHVHAKMTRVATNNLFDAIRREQFEERKRS